MTTPGAPLGGANSRPLSDTVAETGPGIPDDAILDGELGPGELGGREVDASIAALERSGWATPVHDAASQDTAQAEAEVEAHPS